MKRVVLDSLAVFALTFVVAAVVSYLYALVAHGAGMVDWGPAVRLGITLGIVLSWIGSRKVR